MQKVQAQVLQHCVISQMPWNVCSSFDTIHEVLMLRITAAKNRQRSAELCASMSRDASVTQHVKSIVEFYEKQYMETDANKTRTRLVTQQNHELFLLMQKYECLQNSRLQTSSP